MTGRRGRRAAVSAGLVAALASGCSASTGGSTGAASDRVPATSQALVAVALRHVGTEPVEVEFYEDGDVGPGGSLGGQANFWDGGFDVSVRVMPGPDPYSLCDTHTCVPMVTDAGPVTLAWQEASEDNPGSIVVTREVDGEFRYVSMEGYGVRGDPRESARPLGPATLDELAAIVADPELSLTTSKDAVTAGRALVSNPPDGPTLVPGEDP